MDVNDALGAGPRASEVARGPKRCRREGHGTMMWLRQCWGVEGAHFAPRRSEIYVFPLEIRVPTRPDLERLIGHGQCPRSGERRARAEPMGFRRRRVWGSRTPSCGDSRRVGGRGCEDGPSAAIDGGLFSTRGPGRT